MSERQTPPQSPAAPAVASSEPTMQRHEPQPGAASNRLPPALLSTARARTTSDDPNEAAEINIGYTRTG